MKTAVLVTTWMVLLAVSLIEAGQIKRRVVKKLIFDSDNSTSELDSDNGRESTEDGIKNLSVDGKKQLEIKRIKAEGDEIEENNLVDDVPQKLKKRKKVRKVAKKRDGRRMDISQRRSSPYIDDPNFLQQYHYHYVNTDTGSQYETLQQQVQKQLQQQIEEEQNLLKRQVQTQVPYNVNNIYNQDSQNAYDILESEYNQAVNEDVYNNAVDPYNQLLDDDVLTGPYNEDPDRTVGAFNSLNGLMDDSSLQNLIPLIIGSLGLVAVSAAFTPRIPINATSGNSTKPFGLWAIPNLSDLIPGRRRRDVGGDTIAQLYDMEDTLENEITIDTLNNEEDYEGSYLSDQSYIGSYLTSIVNSEVGQEVMWNMLMDSFQQIQNLDWAIVGDGMKQAMLVYSLTADDPECQAAIGCRYGKSLREADYGGGVRSWVEYMMPDQWTTFKMVFSETARGRSDQDCQMYKCEKCLQL